MNTKRNEGELNTFEYTAIRKTKSGHFLPTQSKFSDKIKKYM